MCTGESRDSDVEFVCEILGAPEVKRSLAEPVPVAASEPDDGMSVPVALAEPDDGMSVPDGGAPMSEPQDASDFKFEQPSSILSRPKIFVRVGGVLSPVIYPTDCLLFCEFQVPGVFITLFARDPRKCGKTSIQGTLCVDRMLYNIMSIVVTENVTSAGVLEYVHALGEHCTEMDCLLHVASGLGEDNCTKNVEAFLGKLGPTVRTVMSFLPDETGAFYRFEWTIEEPHRRFDLSMECENRVGRPPLPARDTNPQPRRKRTNHHW